ncbi:MAG: class II D-tagatose-bisphosphate aldolase, non-catalytic subunit [Magnetococcales bacterium]|nr:class II D-tagatose-bisphosphate aldolase, non-catalytic subunit [Magnetococcales bacterium]MBF0150408.1 class II D-tagatose-bisphosphate aldolase, non-catalytic subunit [Magnetococcales bacterium]
MIRRKLLAFTAKRRCTLLGVGPMSLNCVNAAIELANEHDSLIMLVASRRQIDSDDFGGGYVNHWSTDRYAEYVIGRDKKGRVLLARDHGGPWQNDKERKAGLSLRQAMDSAKKSFKTDIESGFDMIHIDPSIDIHGDPNVDEVLQRIYELYEYCWSVARQNQRRILFEIGTEEQSGATHHIDYLAYVLNEVKIFCEKNKLPNPTFVVSQTGTRVMETRNVGSFESPVRLPYELPAGIQVPRIVDLCDQHGVWLKEHNADYLSDEALSWHPKLGIHAANVAPEFGVAETKAFVQLMRQQGLHEECDAFLDLALRSRKWEKWMMSQTDADDTRRAIIAGHYVFSDPVCIELKHKVQSKLPHIHVDDFLKDAVKASIYRYMKFFHLTGPL